MFSAERGELYAADVMTLYDRHEMCIWTWLCARQVLRSQLEVASAERGSFLRTIILAVDAGTPAVRGEVLPAIFAGATLSVVSCFPPNCVAAASRLR